MSATSPVTVEEWRDFLTDYSREVLASGDLTYESWTPDGIVTLPLFTPEAVQSGWLGHEACGEDDIRRAEARLGCPLPASFRNFYLVSNGWPWAGRCGEDAWPIQDVEWLRRHSEFGDLIEAWEGAMDDADLEAVRAALIIGYANGGAGDHWLLTPPSSGDGGEWTAYQWAAGAGETPEPFTDFGALMAAQRGRE